MSVFLAIRLLLAAWVCDISVYSEVKVVLKIIGGLRVIWGFDGN